MHSSSCDNNNNKKSQIYTQIREREKEMINQTQTQTQTQKTPFFSALILWLLLHCPNNYTKDLKKQSQIIIIIIYWNNNSSLFSLLIPPIRPLTSMVGVGEMKRLRNYYLNLRHPHHQNTISMEGRRKWIFPLAIGSILSLFLLFLTTLTTSPSSPLLSFYRYSSSLSSSSSSIFVESKLHPAPISVSNLPTPPRFAYLVSGSSGDGVSLKRTLLSLYHPHNQYVVHLDLEASPQERGELESFVKNHPVFKEFNNVRMITKANLVTYRGPTMVANTLHAAAILLREGGHWDWFINLSASDYPLVTQDGELFSGILEDNLFSWLWSVSLISVFSWLSRWVCSFLAFEAVY